MIAEQGVDKYYDDRGIVVHSNYRRFGMGYELVKTRTLLVNYFSSGFSVK